MSMRPSNTAIKSRRKIAFTLVEMIVALVLGTLLLATLMGVLRRSFSEIVSSTRDDSNFNRMTLLVDQLRRDMSNARRILVGDNRFELVGFGHRDPLTLVATLRPARVVYEIRKDGMRSILVRVQIEDSRGLPSTSVPFVEPVYVGAANLLLTSNEARAFSPLDSMGFEVAVQSSQTGQRDAVPSSVQIVILDQRGGTILDQTFTHERDAQ